MVSHRRTAGRVLCLDRQATRRRGTISFRPAKRFWCATSAAGRRTSRSSASVSGRWRGAVSSRCGWRSPDPRRRQHRPRARPSSRTENQRRRQARTAAMSVLVRSCRQVKEVLLGDNPPEQYTLALPGSGSKLIGGGLQVVITAAGSRTARDGRVLPASSARREAAGRTVWISGTRAGRSRQIRRRQNYLAAFLSAHRHAGDDGTEDTLTMPLDLICCCSNGGVFESVAPAAAADRSFAVLVR